MFSKPAPAAIEGSYPPLAPAISSTSSFFSIIFVPVGLLTPAEPAAFSSALANAAPALPALPDFKASIT